MNNLSKKILKEFEEAFRNPIQANAKEGFINLYGKVFRIEMNEAFNPQMFVTMSVGQSKQMYKVLKMGIGVIENNQVVKLGKMEYLITAKNGEFTSSINLDDNVLTYLRSIRK